MPGEDAYEFYPCLVDGTPASIYVNLRFESSPPPAADTRYTIAIAMREPGEYGIGTADKAGALDLVERDNAPGLLDRGENLFRSRARWAAVVSHACTRHDACGTDEPSCAVIGVPDTDDRETAACRKEIDAMPCENLMGVFLNTPPPACAELREKAR